MALMQAEQTAYEDIVHNFMVEQYSLAPSPSSIDLLINTILAKTSLDNNPIKNFFKVARAIGHNDSDTLVAKVFALAYPYEPIMNNATNGLKVKWTAWLGISEYHLGKKIKGKQSSEALFKSAINHFLSLYYNDKLPKQNYVYISDSYRRLGKFEDALSFLLESKGMGYYTKESASLTGRCHFELREFNEGVLEFKNAMEMTENGAFNAEWVRFFQYSLDRASHLLYLSRHKIRMGVYNRFLGRPHKVVDMLTNYRMQ